MPNLEMTLDEAVDHLTNGARTFDAAQRLESRVHAFREAVLEEDADATNETAAALAEYLWNPESVSACRRVLFEFTRAMNEAVSPAIRMVLQHHQAYALEALAEGMLDLGLGRDALAENILSLGQGEDDGSDDDCEPSGGGGVAAPQSSAEPLQPGA